MTQKEFLKAGKLIKQHNMDISQITKCVNLFLAEGIHVCEQEMVNYLAKQGLKCRFVLAGTENDPTDILELHERRLKTLV